MVDELCHEIIGASIEVHKLFGPGLLERIYSQCLCRELTLRGLSYNTEVPIPLIYKGTQLDITFVEDTIIVELKSVLEMNPIFEAQLISYLTLSKKPTGLLINFNVPVLKNGIKRLFPKQVPESVAL